MYLDNRCCKQIKISNNITRYPLPATRNPQPASRYPQPATRYPQPATHYPLPTTHYPLLIILLFLITPVIFSQEGEDIAIVRQLEEDPAELMSLSLGDSDVSLFLTGTWKGALHGNIGLGFSPLGRAFTSPESPFLFAQEADLSLSLWINDKWFVEANIQDNSKENTYRAGFQGQPGDFVRYAGIGNTGLDFPVFPYLDLGGDSPSSFGYYGLMGTQNFSIHSLVRYDTSSREEKIFTGSRERTESIVEPQNYIRAVSFVLPEENIDSDILVYFEDETGPLTDEKGRRWRLAMRSEYAAGNREGLIEMGIRPYGMVAVYYSNVGSNLGSYDGGGFLGEAQERFNRYDENGNIIGSVNLGNYPQCGGGIGRPGTVIINGNSSLVLYEPGCFSPFERLSRYDAPSSASEQASVIRLSTGGVRNDFELVQLSSSSIASDIPLYMPDSSRRHVYGLLSVNPDTSVSVKNTRDPINRWPLIKEYPYIYLPAGNVYSGDTVLRFINYSDLSGYFIGADVVEGSVQVYRSGILDSNFRFNPSSGEVTLFSPAGINETIRITYLRKSEKASLGSIAAGIGVIYNKNNNPFSAEAGFGVRWNLTEQGAFTEEENSSLGTIGVSAKTSWEYDNFKAHIAAGFSYEQTDTTGLYRAAGMENNEEVMPLPIDTSFLSHPAQTALASIPILDIANRADLIYRNYYSNSVIGSTLMPVSWNGSVIVSGINKPYPVKDPLMGDRHLLAAEFNLQANQWTGFEFPLGEISNFISSSSEILIPYRLYGFEGDVPANIKIIIQIGSLSSIDFPITENPELIWEKELSLNNVDADGRQIAVFSLSIQDRLRLAGANHFRLAVINEDAYPIAGRVLLASPIIRGASFRPVIIENDSVKDAQDSFVNSVKAFETTELEQPFLENAFPSILKRLHPGNSVQRVLKIQWENMQQGVSAGADGRMAELPLNDYREISFFIKAPNYLFGATGEKLRFIVATSADSLQRPVLSAEIPLNNLSSGVWSKITIKHLSNEKGISVNGQKIENAKILYNPINLGMRENSVHYVAFFIDPSSQDGQLNDGNIYIDEIILEDPRIVYRVNAGSALEYVKNGTILSFSNVEALSDFRIASAAESEIRTSANQDENNNFSLGFANRTGMSVSVFGASVEGNAAINAANDVVLAWSADHSVSKSIGSFSVMENFFASPFDSNARHRVNLSFLSDFHAKFDADALYELSKLKQKWNIGTGYRPQNELIPSIAFISDFSYVKNNQLNENDNYAKLWINSWKPIIPDSGSLADTRNTLTKILITQRTKPVGAVLTLQGGTQFTAINNLTQTDNSLFIDIPVAINQTNINFRTGRQLKKHINFSGVDVFDDTQKLFEHIREASPLWGAVPFYSLFAESLNSKMDNMLNNSSTSEVSVFNSFNDHFSVSLNLPRRNDLTSFFIPVRTSLRLDRTIEQKMDTRADVLNLGAGLNFSAVNSFGSMGYKPLFNFYRTDEFNHSIQTAFAFNNDETVLWRIQSSLGAGFRTANGTVGFMNTFTIRNGSRAAKTEAPQPHNTSYSRTNWTESVTMDWTTPAYKTLTGFLYQKISNAASRQNSWPALSSLLSQEYEQLRKESLELVFDKSDDYLRWRIILGHEEIIRIFARLEFTGFAKLRFTDDRYTELFIVDMLVGTTLRIQF